MPPASDATSTYTALIRWRVLSTNGSVDNLIDFYSPYKPPQQREQDSVELPRIDGLDQDIDLIPNEKEYMEKYINPDAFIAEQKERRKKRRAAATKIPSTQQARRDGVLMCHAPLRRWRDILDMLREEAYYFAPQAMTKIMNEGWASYWHAKLMTEKGHGLIRTY